MSDHDGLDEVITMRGMRIRAVELDAPLQAARVDRATTVIVDRSAYVIAVGASRRIGAMSRR